MVYWHNQPYLGAGVAAHSYIDGSRIANTADLGNYLSAYSGNTPPSHDLNEEIGPELQLSETVILGLRLSEGIEADEIQRRFGIDLMSQYRQQVAEAESLGLLECAGSRIRLTRKGRLLGNEVFWRFLPE
jgi:oxygen-independent coproporphyrinogen-3 oxidase